MKYLLVLLATRLSLCFDFSKLRIVNGTDAELGEFPFAVSLRRQASHCCGGSILNEKFILTAAHCACTENKPHDKPEDFSVQYGLINITEDSVNSVPVATILCHNFNSSALVYDSAILELNSSLPNDGLWQAVTLSKTFHSSNKQTGTIIGWGRLYAEGPISPILQKLDVEIYEDEFCNRMFDNKHHICFGADIGGACNGDSGSALLVNGRQVGIASFITNRCGIANRQTPNVYSRVNNYKDWIQNIAGDTKWH